MALKGNPNILEWLNTPLVDFASPLAQALVASRKAFLSKLIYQIAFCFSSFSYASPPLFPMWAGQCNWPQNTNSSPLFRTLYDGKSAMWRTTRFSPEHAGTVLKTTCALT